MNDDESVMESESFTSDSNSGSEKLMRMVRIRHSGLGALLDEAEVVAHIEDAKKIDISFRSNKALKVKTKE